MMRDTVVWVLAVCIVVLGFGGVGFAEGAQTIQLNQPNLQSGWSPPRVDLNTKPPADVTSAVVGEEMQSVNTDWRLMTSNQEILAPQPDTDSWLVQADSKDTETTEEVLEDAGSSGLEITVTGDWVSKYMFRGFDVYDDRGAWQPSVDIALWNSGFHLNWWASYVSTSRNDDDLVQQGLGRELDEHDYTLYWEGGIGDCIDVELGMIYYDIFRQDSEKLDFWEWYGVFTLSSLPLSPYFGAYYGTPKRRANGGEGWMTTIGVSHSVDLCGLSVCGNPLALDLAADVWYNGGEFVDGVDTGWSHATFGGSLPIPLSENLTFTPGVYYQLSMEDTVNNEDEWWATLSLEYAWK